MYCLCQTLQAVCISFVIALLPFLGRYLCISVHFTSGSRIVFCSDASRLFNVVSGQPMYLYLVSRQSFCVYCRLNCWRSTGHPMRLLNVPYSLRSELSRSPCQFFSFLSHSHFCGLILRWDSLLLPSNQLCFTILVLVVSLILPRWAAFLLVWVF